MQALASIAELASQLALWELFRLDKSIILIDHITNSAAAMRQLFFLKTLTVQRSL